MNTKFSVEPGTREDIDELARLFDELNDYLAETINWPGWRKGLYPVRQTAEDAVEKGTLFVVRDEEGVIAGTVRLTHEPEPAYFKAIWGIEADYSELIVVHTLAVHPSYMKKGPSRLMLNFAEEYGRKQGIKAIRLDVSVHNQPAIRLYESCGYRYVDTVDLELGIPGLEYFRLYELIL